MHRELGALLKKTNRFTATRMIAYFAGIVLILIGAFSTAYGWHATQLMNTRTSGLKVVQATDGDEVKFLYRIDYASLGEKNVTVVAVDVQDEQLVPPAGISKWPQEGHVAISPALEAELSNIDPNYYGPVDEVISLEGLETPNDRRVYIRVPDGFGDLNGFKQGASFGGPLDQLAGVGTGYLYAAPFNEIAFGSFAFLIVPGIFSLILGAWSDSAAERKKAYVLHAIGTRPSVLAIQDLRQALLPAFLASILVWAGYAVLCAHEVRVEFLDLIVPRQDALTAIPLIVAAFFVALLVSAMTILTSRILAHIRTRGRVPNDSERFGYTGALACVAAIFLSVYIPETAGPGVVSRMTFIIATLVCILTFRSLLRTATQLFGQFLCVIARRMSSSSALVVGRAFGRFPARAVGVAFCLGAMILILGQGQLWSSTLSNQYVSSTEFREHRGDTVLIGRTATTSAEEFLESAPGHAVLLGGDGMSAIEIAAPCKNLKELGLPCSGAVDDLEAVSDNLVAELGREANLIQTASGSWEELLARDVPGSIVLVALDGQAYNLDQIQTLAFQEIPGGLNFGTTALNWIGGGTSNLNKSHYILLWVAISMLGLGASMWSAARNDSEKHAATLNKIVVLTNKTSWVSAAQFLLTATPLFFSGILAVALYNVLPLSMGYANGATVIFTPSNTFSVSMLAVTVIVAVGAGIASTRQRGLAGTM